jgi:hypothetical protein
MLAFYEAAYHPKRGSNQEAGGKESMVLSLR